MDRPPVEREIVLKTTVLLTICVTLLIPASAAACAACTSVSNPDCGAGWSPATGLCTVGCYSADPASGPGETFTCYTGSFSECLSLAVGMQECPQPPPGSDPDDGTGGLDMCDPNTSHP